MNFYIDEDYLTDVTVRTDYGRSINRDNPSHNDLIEVLKNPHQSYSIGTIDHPEFTKLRNQLEQQGYIVTERKWWNGDRVLKPFELNGFRFEIDDKFCCASAMKFDFQVKRKYQPKGGHDA